MTKPTGKSPVIQSLDLAITILMKLAESPDLTLTGLARSLGETKQRILRSLRSMEHRGLVYRTHVNGYRLGNAVLVLGSAASTQIDLVKIAGPVLESVALKSFETVQLRIRLNSEALCIAKVEPSRDLRVHAVVGRRRPLYAGSSKVLLAFLPEAMRDELLPTTFERFTPNTICNRVELIQELENIRSRGFCISRGEVSDQLVSVAFPVRGFDGSVLASINIAAPEFRTQEGDLARFVSLLTEAAARISRGLGWSTSKGPDTLIFKART